MIFKPTERERAIVYIDKLFERKRNVKIDMIAHIATISQNSYCWLVFTHVADQTGNSKEDIYQLCLEMFPTFKEVIINGEKHLIKITLSGMDKDQKSKFIDSFTTFFRVEGFDVPDPETKKAQEMYQYYRDRGIL